LYWRRRSRNLCSRDPAELIRRARSFRKVRLRHAVTQVIEHLCYRTATLLLAAPPAHQRTCIVSTPFPLASTAVSSCQESQPRALQGPLPASRRDCMLRRSSDGGECFQAYGDPARRRLSNNRDVSLSWITACVAPAYLICPSQRISTCLDSTARLFIDLYESSQLSASALDGKRPRDSPSDADCWSFLSVRHEQRKSRSAGRADAIR